MNRRRTRRQDGFSFIELLITIVLAGIVFAAMVPMFVGAQKSNSGDSMRNISLNIAQERIERIRQLDFDQITLANLDDESFQGGLFGNVATANVGTQSRTFAVSYAVSTVSGAVAGPGSSGQAAYKEVTVTVTWTAPPSPVKAAVLRTFISKQFAGPQLDNLAVDSSDLDAATGYIVSNLVDLRATVNQADIANTKRVKFFVYDINGALVARSEVLSDGDAVFDWQWNATAATDGTYVFQAVAMSYSGFPGNTWQRDHRLERGAPAAPTGLTAIAGNKVVNLSWDKCLSGDWDHYEVWRGLAADLSDGSALTVTSTTEAYSDTNVVNGVTYYYAVYAVDDLGNRSAASAIVVAGPGVQLDTTPPSAPGNFAAADSGQSATLSWDNSYDPTNPAPTSGLAGYYIYRDGNLSAVYAAVPSTLEGPPVGTYARITWSENIGWGATHTYVVKAFDVVGNLSVAAGPLTVSTGTPPTFRLTVLCETNNWTNVTVYDGAGVSQGTKAVKKNQSRYWDLPYGTYLVRAEYMGATKEQTINLSADTSVSFSFP